MYRAEALCTGSCSKSILQKDILSVVGFSINTRKGEHSNVRPLERDFSWVQFILSLWLVCKLKDN